MKINYRLMNNILDGFYIWGLPIIFVALSGFVNSITYSIVSVGYLCFVIFCAIRKYREDKISKEEIMHDEVNEKKEIIATPL